VNTTGWTLSAIVRWVGRQEGMGGGVGPVRTGRTAAGACLKCPESPSRAGQAGVQAPVLGCEQHVYELSKNAGEIGEGNNLISPGQ